MSASNIVIYLLRHDLRISDNPILHHLATAEDHGFTHLLPVYVFPAHQMETSGFVRDGSKSPYPEARGQVSGFWRCGPHRAKFIAQSVWDLKELFQDIGSDLCFRVGSFDDVLRDLLRGFSEHQKVGAVWMTEEVAVEEKQDERAVSSICAEHGIDFKAWQDEKYFVDDRDTNLDKIQDLPDVFTTYRKTQEPLRSRPRTPLRKPDGHALPPLPDQSSTPFPAGPFEIPTAYGDLESSLLRPVEVLLPDGPKFPDGAASVHPLDGGESNALKRVDHLIRTGAMSKYNETRNGLLGVDYSTKLSGYLALGCLSARQVHEELVKFEDGQGDEYKDMDGFGQGENDGTRAVRLELLWRDYMRLCTKKFGAKLFRLSGFRDDKSDKWRCTSSKDPSGQTDEVSRILHRLLVGNTGHGLIDASQRELYHTGYTSNRARQNVASFAAKHLGLDWRHGAEWYECVLIDYDVHSNWANWQYVSGVGNDPRGEARIFNPVKQAFDYDKQGEYVKMWVPEVRGLEKLEHVFQPWTAPPEDLERLGLLDSAMVKDPVKKIEFCVEGKPKSSRRPHARRRGRGGYGGNRGGGNGGGSGDHGGQKQKQYQKNASFHSAPPQQPRSHYDHYDPGQHQNQQGHVYPGFRSNHDGYRGQYRGYRGLGGGGRGYRGGRGSYGGGGGRGQSGWAHGAPTGYMAMNPPYWTTTNPGLT